MKKWSRSLIVALLIVGLGSISIPAAAEEEAEGSFWDKTKVSGTADINYNYNINRPNNATGAGAANGYRVFDVNPDTFNLGLIEIALENSPNDWVTFRTDLDFGRDASFIHAAGLGAATDIFDLQQAYIVLKAADVGNGLSFKIGKFVTMHGAEVIEASANNNVSRSILFNYAIPFTHTGILASYPFSDAIALDFGVVNGWNTVTDNNGGKTIHAQVTLKPTEKLTWYLGGSLGPEAAVVETPLTYLLDTTLAYALNDMTTLTLNYDFGVNSPAGGASGAIADWQGVAAYAHVKPFDFFGLTIRGEYYLDNVGTLGAPTGATASTKLFEGTGTAHFYLSEGLDLRFEFRHDQGNNASFLAGTGASKKFQDTVASQLVYAF